jgi:hypothetical protein
MARTLSLLKEGLMRQILFTLMMVFAAPMLLVNCNGKGGSGPATVAGPVGGVNASNYGAGGCVYTSPGVCLPQGSCPSNFGSQGLECLPAAGPNGVCSLPQVMTQFGCLSRETCPPNQAMYEGTCVAEVRSASRPR